MTTTGACLFCGSPLPSGGPCPACGAVDPDGGGDHLPEGSQLQGGRYAIGRVLGQGGFGITYAATDARLHARVAIKELFPLGATRRGASLVLARGTTAAGFREERDRFLTEARSLARFAHPHIVRVLDAFEENQTAYAVMELVPGPTLERRVHATGPITAREARSLATELLAALEAVHAAGLLHRDLKPANVLLAPDRAVLIDFGAARELAADRTALHSRIVSDGFAPLEQYASLARRGPSTDLYALAATLYFALAGRPPPSAVDRATGATVPPLPVSVRAADASLARAILAGLAMSVRDRPQSASEFRALLAAPGPPQVVTTVPPPAVAPVPRPAVVAVASVPRAPAPPPPGPPARQTSDSSALLVVGAVGLLAVLASTIPLSSRPSVPPPAPPSAGSATRATAPTAARERAPGGCGIVLDARKLKPALASSPSPAIVDPTGRRVWPDAELVRETDSTLVDAGVAAYGRTPEDARESLSDRLGADGELVEVRAVATARSELTPRSSYFVNAVVSTSDGERIRQAGPRCAAVFLR